MRIESFIETLNDVNPQRVCDKTGLSKCRHLVLYESKSRKFLDLNHIEFTYVLHIQKYLVCTLD